jgi:tetratricopeptide (TPR) repeat protein
MQRMQAKRRRYHRTAPRSAGQGVKQTEQQERVGDVQRQTRQVMPGWPKPKPLAIQHVRPPRHWVPVSRVRVPQRPLQSGQRQAGFDWRIVGNVIGVVIIGEGAPRHGQIDHYDDEAEQSCCYRRAAPSASAHNSGRNRFPGLGLTFATTIRPWAFTKGKVSLARERVNQETGYRYLLLLTDGNWNETVEKHKSLFSSVPAGHSETEMCARRLGPNACFLDILKILPHASDSVMKSYPAFSYFSVIRGAILFTFMLAACPLGSVAAENGPETAKETNSLELRTYLQLQEQLHATQLAIERNRKEADYAAAQATEALAGRLQAIEQSLLTQRARELEAMQSSNKVMLVVAGAFAAMGFMAMLLMAYFQWRTVSRLAEISAALPGAGRALGAGRPIASLGPGDTQFIPVGRAEQSNLRMIDALERLEKRIHELEHTAHPPLQEATVFNAEPAPANSGPANGSPANGTAATEAARIRMLLGKGQSLLNLDQAEDALVCFDEALKLDSRNTEALVKKGAALERLRKLDEAIDCYDRAIAADDSMTIAYLYKGGLFNRMERFNEALECYEQALRTQEKGSA